jgi:hypothetical protein
MVHRQAIPGAIGTTAADARQSIAEFKPSAADANKTLPNDARDFSLLARPGHFRMRAEGRWRRRAPGPAADDCSGQYRLLGRIRRGAKMETEWGGFASGARLF